MQVSWSQIVQDISNQFPGAQMEEPTQQRWKYFALMLDHRLRRWPNMKPAVGQLLVFTVQRTNKYEKYQSLITR